MWCVVFRTCLVHGGLVPIPSRKRSARKGPFWTHVRRLTHTHTCVYRGLLTHRRSNTRPIRTRGKHPYPWKVESAVTAPLTPKNIGTGTGVRGPPWSDRRPDSAKIPLSVCELVYTPAKPPSRTQTSGSVRRLSRRGKSVRGEPSLRILRRIRRRSST